MCTEYEGWSNQPTWTVNVWLSNDRALYQSACDMVTEANSLHEAADNLQELIDELSVGELIENLPDIPGALLSYAFGLVNWRELAEHWTTNLGISVNEDGSFIR